MRINTRTAPTKRTLACLEAGGWLADVAEHRQGPITLDLFDIVDVVAVHPVRREFLFVQVTSNNGGNVAARMAKLRAHRNTQKLLQAGARVEVWGWSHQRAAPRVVRLRLGTPSGQDTTR